MSALSINNLHKVYANGFVALKGIDLEVSEGDFFALLGPNGAGKSTAIGIISSLVTKSSGQVSVFGNDLDREMEAVKSCIGLVPQEFNFNQWESVGEVVINQAGYYGIRRREAIRRAEASLRELDLWDRRDEQSRNLSGGMKRRLMIARALVHRPKLLILDEPTAGVDIEIRRSMWRFMTELNRQGTTIILTTHYLEEAESLCRNIAIINQGDIVENTSMDSLLHEMHSETFVLNTGAPINQVPRVEGYAIHLRDDGLLEAVVDREMGINKLFSGLSEQGVVISSMRNKQNRLEQLFIDMVENSRSGETQ